MRFESTDFEGLTPAVEPRRSDKLYALGGENYVLDSFGPRSVFGNRFLTPYVLGRPEWTQGVRLRLRTGDRVFTFTSDAILEWKEEDGGWRVLYSFPSLAGQPYRWTYGYLNDIMYFCHPGVGILAYIIASDVCLPLESDGAPEQPISVEICNGRLTALTEKALIWSGPGDGLDWIPRLGGAGFQLVNDRVPGYPITSTSYARGVLTWTTGGVMRSEFTGDAAVFRHRALITEHRPINSLCVFRMDEDTVGFLDERGIFVSQGEPPKPLTPLFNEFLIDYLQRNNLNVGENVRIEWDDLQRRLYLSMSLSESDPLYERAFVLYTPLDRWGVFNEAHYGIIPILVSSSSRGDDYFGFVDSSGRVRYWNISGSREILPAAVPALNARYPLMQKPATQDLSGEHIVLGSSAVVNTIPEIDYTQRAGFYGAEGLSPATQVLTGLDARVSLGLIRGRTDLAHDRLIEITRMAVGNVVSGEEGVTVVDFNTVPDGVDDEDYNTGLGVDDYGVDGRNYVDHGLRIIGTIDGSSLWSETEPQLVMFSRAQREFSCSAVGLWHIIELTAEEIGQAFHVRTLELTAIDAGSLT